MTASDSIATGKLQDRDRPRGVDPYQDGTASTSDFAIETRDLTKHFGETKAVDGVDLSIPRGGIYGLLGPNGAGKTTTIRMLATLLRPDAGTATVLGHDVRSEAAAVRRRVSLTGQFASVDEDLTGRENLRLLARLYGYGRSEAKERAAELLGAFGLNDAANRQVKTYSGGMGRRLDIAASLVVTPDLLFLDEPTTGLDPRNRNQVWQIIEALVADGSTVLLTTQHLEEADHLADRIAVIDDGRIIAEGTPSELKASIGSGVLSIRVHDPDRRDDALRIVGERIEETVDIAADPHALTARVPDANTALELVSALSESNVEVTDFSLGQPSLDEVFLSLTDHSADASRDGEPR